MLDKPGKDSYQHAEAGALEVILAVSNGFALFSRQQEAPLPELLERLLPVDLVLVEGFKNYSMPKLEVYRPSVGKPPLWPEMDVLAVVSDVDCRSVRCRCCVWMSPPGLRISSRQRFG